MMEWNWHYNRTAFPHPLNLCHRYLLLSVAPRLAGSRFISFRSGLITAINGEIPAKFPQIRLRRTSVNRKR